MKKNNFRTKIKKDVTSQLLKINTENKEEEMEKNELGLRLLKFFEYEQDPEFEKWFNNFCYKKKIEKEEQEER